ncbi:MAG: 2-hydroxyacyl-CoA dehydratase [Actinobacteria bacterium]|nr:2-hydroxyacyl-CoA dehydratase [Actinomycetota bacterium]
MTIETKVDELLLHRQEELENAKSAGKKVVGYFPGGYVPEELIYAAGAIPICLSHGGDARTADEALSIMPHVICPFARAQVGEMMLKTNPFYTAVDLVVVPSTCQHMKKIGDFWEYYEGPKVFKLGVPYEHDKDFEVQYFRDRLVALKERLETLTGNTVTDDRLAEAIVVYDRLRSLLKALSLTRRGAGRAIGALDFVRLNHASLYADPVVMADTLEAVLEGLPEAAPGRPRVLLTGPNLVLGDYDVLALADEVGAEVVIEEIFEGVRDYWQTIDQTGDPLDALVRGYLIEKRPAAFMRGSTSKRLEFIRSLIEGFEVQGVLWYQLLCCEFYDEEGSYIETALRDDGIPVLVVESDYHSLDSGQMKTRLAAFVETMAGGPVDA